MRDLYLAVDVGTGNLRAALVDRAGKILAIARREHEQIVPQFGWSEQRPADWWADTQETIREVLTLVDRAAARVSAISVCGQMHATVLVDEDGNLTRETAPLWNDKRTLDIVENFSVHHAPDSYLAQTANPASPAWPAFKLCWLAEHDSKAMARTRHVLMPKDWINFKLTGIYGQDRTEGSMSFLMDAKTRDWSDDLTCLTGISRHLLPPLHDPLEILGGLGSQVAAKLGLTAGIPVLVGGGDYPTALLGSGVLAPGMASDVTGTSTIVTLIHEKPVIDMAVSNVATIDGNWGSFVLLDAGGDAVRWARRAFHENRRSYSELASLAKQAAVGANNLFFMPYLSGERLSEQRNARAHFFGLTASHGLAELHRAVLEGVAFSVRFRLGSLQAGNVQAERFVASSGGAKSDLWLKIKASMYHTPYLVPRELECGLVGAAAMMAVSVGHKPDLSAAIGDMVAFEREILPDPDWAEKYDKMMPIYARLYEMTKSLHYDLDTLAQR